MTSATPTTLLHRLGRYRRFGLTLALFVLVLGANWAVFDRYGSDMPDWDQWDAEDVYLLVPWYTHDHFVAHLFHPQNEHRVILTKLQNLATVVASGQWDVRIEVLFNTVLHAFIAVGLWCFARRWLARRWHVLAYLVVAALYALPLSCQNLLCGFHNQQYWLIGLSFAAIVLMPWARTWSWQWWLGSISAILALGSMGSGCFAAAVIFGLVIWRWLAREITARTAWPSLVVTVAVMAVGIATRVVVDYHEFLKAHSVGEFVLYLVRSFEWPFYLHDWAGLIMWSPWVVLTIVAVQRLWTAWRRGVPAEPAMTSQARLAIMGLGLWVVLQLLATAYARGAGANYPASRYMDTLMFGAAANAFALGWMLSNRTAPAAGRAAVGHSVESESLALASGRSSRVGTVVVGAWGLVWLVSLAVGLRALVLSNVGGELPQNKTYYVECEAHLRAYLATNDPAELTHPIPYLTAPLLVQRLEPAVIRRLMPSSVRPPLPLQPATSGTGFLRNWASQRRLDTAPRVGLAPDMPALASRPTWGSYNARGLANEATWRSQPLTAPLHGWLRIETGGDIGKPGIRLELRDAATDRPLGSIRPSKLPGESWRTAYIKAPARPFIIFAQDASPRGWLAFSAPVEMSNFSYWAWQVTKNGLLIAEIAGGAIVVLALGSLVSGSGRRDRRRHRQAANAVATA